MAAGEMSKSEILKRITDLVLRTDREAELSPESFDNLLRSPAYARNHRYPKVEARGAWKL
jgi:hypothetical protein